MEGEEDEWQQRSRLMEILEFEVYFFAQTHRKRALEQAASFMNILLHPVQSIRWEIYPESAMRRSPRKRVSQLTFEKITEKEDLHFILRYLQCDLVNVMAKSTTPKSHGSFFYNASTIYEYFGRNDTVIYTLKSVDGTIGYCCMRIAAERKTVSIDIFEILVPWQRRGFGRVMFNRIVEFSRGHGITTLICSPIEEAFSFWQKVGFPPREGNQRYLTMTIQ